MSGHALFHLDPIDGRDELIKLICVLLESRDIVVADQEHLVTEGSAGLVYYLDQPRYEIRP